MLYNDERIRQVVWRNIHPEPNTACWLWSGYVNADGYGRGYAVAGGKLTMAHRITYEALVGPIPAGYELDHLCNVRPCCNPEHLEAVTHLENVLRMRHRQTHCKWGHEFTPENTDMVRNGEVRACLACRRVRNAAHVARVKADSKLREHRNALSRGSWAARKTARLDNYKKA